MNELDFSLWDQIERHREESKQAEWELTKEAYKRAGELEARIICTGIAVAFIIATFCLETPH